MLTPVAVLAAARPRVHALAVSVAVALAQRARAVLSAFARGAVAHAVPAYRVAGAIVTAREQRAVASRETAFTKALGRAVRGC